MGFGLNFKKFVLVSGFLSFSYCWGMDYNIDNDKDDDSEIFSVDKIDKTKIPAITLKPMDLGKVGLELEIENNKYALTLDPKGEVDKTQLPEEYRDLVAYSGGISWLLPDKNLDINFTWTRTWNYDDKKTRRIDVRVNDNLPPYKSWDIEFRGRSLLRPTNSNIPLEQMLERRSFSINFIKQRDGDECIVKVLSRSSLHYVKLSGIGLKNDKGAFSVNILDLEGADFFAGYKFDEFTKLLGVESEKKDFVVKQEKDVEVIKNIHQHPMNENKVDPFRFCSEYVDIRNRPNIFSVIDNIFNFVNLNSSNQ